MPIPTFEEDIVIEQGATFPGSYTIKQGPSLSDQTAVDLSGYTSAKMQIRATADADDALVTVDTAGGGIVLGGVDGTITISISDEVTAALTPGNAVYDLLLYGADGTVDKPLRGAVKIMAGTTR